MSDNETPTPTWQEAITVTCTNHPLSVFAEMYLTKEGNKCEICDTVAVCSCGFRYRKSYQLKQHLSRSPQHPELNKNPRAAQRRVVGGE